LPAHGGRARFSDFSDPRESAANSRPDESIPSLSSDRFVPDPRYFQRFKQIAVVAFRRVEPPFQVFDLGADGLKLSNQSRGCMSRIHVVGLRLVGTVRGFTIRKTEPVELLGRPLLLQAYRVEHQLEVGFKPVMSLDKLLVSLQVLLAQLVCRLLLVPKLAMLIVESGEFGMDPIPFDAMGRVGEVERPAETLDLGTKRFAFFHQAAHVLRRDRSQVGADSSEIGCDAAQLFADLLVLDLVAGITGRVTAGFFLKLFVLGQESVMLGPKPIVLGFRSGASTLDVGLVEICVRDPSMIADRRFRLRLRWVPHGESVIALFAEDLVAKVGAPDAQGRLTARTNDDDSVGLDRLMNRWTDCAYFPIRVNRCLRFLGEERVVAVLAEYVSADVLAVNPQAS
jgi:hypothetical protein